MQEENRIVFGPPARKKIYEEHIGKYLDTWNSNGNIVGRLILVKEGIAYFSPYIERTYSDKEEARYRINESGILEVKLKDNQFENLKVVDEKYLKNAVKFLNKPKQNPPEQKSK